MADITKTVQIIFQGQDETNPAIAGIERAMAGLGGEASLAAGRVNQLDTEVGNLGGKTANIEAMVLAFKALASAVVVKEFIDANVEAEQFNRAMTQLKGSTTDAAKEFDYIKDASNRLGLELSKMSSAYVSLTAATTGTALAGQPTRDIFEAVAGAMGKLGKSSADTEGALLAITQMVSKGKVSMEELRGQLGERLPGAFKIAADSMGITTSELDKLVSDGNLATDVFLPKLAAGLRATFGDTTYVEGFTASMARLKNSLNDAFVQIGQTGAFEALTKGLQIATATAVGAAAGVRALGEIIGALAGAAASGNWKEFGAAVEAAMDKFKATTKESAEAMLGLKDATDKTGLTVVNVSDAVSRKFADNAKQGLGDTKKAAEDLNKSLKELGIDPKQFEKPIEAIVKAFTDLANNPSLKDGEGGPQILTGLLVTLDKIQNGPKGLQALEAVTAGVESAYKRSALSAEQYAAATQALEVKQSGLWDGMIRTTGSIQDQKKAHEEAAKATEKQRDQAQAFRLELEKLASNERIKLIESKVTLNVAEFEYKAKIIESAFDSIDTAIESTGKSVTDLFKLMDNPTIGFSDKWMLEDQIAKENQRREEAFRLQKLLTQATIDEITARVKAFQSGDALIKIDGAGLQPHLEAFMWEILRTLQTRVNRDGLKLLLNT